MRRSRLVVVAVVLTLGIAVSDVRSISVHLAAALGNPVPLAENDPTPALEAPEEDSCTLNGSTPRPDTISPIPEGIPLLEAERLARQREPGDGSSQQTVTEKLDIALAESK